MGIKKITIAGATAAPLGLAVWADTGTAFAASRAPTPVDHASMTMVATDTHDEPADRSVQPDPAKDHERTTVARTATTVTASEPTSLNNRRAPPIGRVTEQRREEAA